MKIKTFLVILILSLNIGCSLNPSFDPKNSKRVELAQQKVETSPKAPWGEFKVVEKSKPTILTQALLWIPNRIADLIDVFRIDAGVGPSFGAVVRVSEHFQAGYRNLSPLSLRIGNFGRHEYPVLVETSNEIGVSPAFIQSNDRNICSSEIGVGADIFLVGAYGGICIQELADFIAGLFFFDLNDDDWE